MKKEVPLSKANRLINSGCTILVTCSYKDKTNIITLAWSTPLSHSPALLGISIAQTHFSSELIEKSGEFIINIPTLDLLEEVLYCGKISGRDADKFSHTHLTAEKAYRLTKTPLLKECVGHLECRVRDIKKVGDHMFFIGETIYACAAEELFAETWDTSKVKLLFHLGGRFFTTPEKMIAS